MPKKNTHAHPTSMKMSRMFFSRDLSIMSPSRSRSIWRSSAARALRLTSLYTRSAGKTQAQRAAQQTHGAGLSTELARRALPHYTRVVCRTLESRTAACAHTPIGPRHARPHPHAGHSSRARPRVGTHPTQQAHTGLSPRASPRLRVCGHAKKLHPCPACEPRYMLTVLCAADARCLC